MSTFTLSELELACGITLDAVRTARSQAMTHLTREGFRVVVAPEVGPALGGAVARMALGVRAEYLGMNALKCPVFGPAESVL